MKLLFVVLKDMQLATRPRSAVIALLVLPLVVILVVVGVESGDSARILLPVVDQDHGIVADTMCGALREYLDVRLTDRATAERLVIENEAPAVLILPADLSQRYRAQRSSTIQLLTDPAQWQELSAIRVLLLLAERKLASIDDPFATELLHLQERSVTTKQTNIPKLEQRIPGLTVTFVLLNMVLSVAFAVHDERGRGVSFRLAVAPVSRALLLIGKTVAWIVLGTAQLMILLAVGHIVYGLNLGNPLAMTSVAVCSVFSMAGFALAVGTASRSREQVVPIGLAAVFAVAMIGGCWWPSFLLPHWLQVLGRATMTSWSMAALQDVILRNRTVWMVAPKLLVLVAQGLLWLAVAVALGQRPEASTTRRWLRSAAQRNLA